MLSLPPIARTPSNDEIRRYLPLVERIVSHMRRRLPSHISRSDLVAAGQRGLVDALTRDRIGGPQFEHYAAIRIRGAIYDELRSLDWTPRSTRSGERTRSVVMFEDLGPAEQAEHSCDLDARDPSELLLGCEEQETLKRAIESLGERDRLIIRMRYFEGAQFDEIGEKLAVTPARVSQLHSRAIVRLRSLMVD
jgi:RNA polymerase sigma factor FliA